MEVPGLCASFVMDAPPVQANYPVHAHDSHEIFFLLSGHCRFITHRAALIPTPGTVTVFPACEIHGLTVYDTPLSYVTLQFLPSVLPPDPALSALTEAIFGTSASERHYLFHLPEESVPFVRETLLRLCRIQEGEVFREAFFHYLKPVLFEMHQFGTVQTAAARRKNRTNEHDTELFELVTAYISAHLADITDLSFIEREFHYSPAHVNRLFRRTVTESTWQYIIHKRLDRASDMILDGNSAASASSACGFGDYSVFYRLFVRNYGMTPSDMKRSMKKPSLTGKSSG